MLELRLPSRASSMLGPLVSRRRPAVGRGLAVLCAVVLLLGAQTTAASAVSFVTKWGTYGLGNGQFNGPRAVAVDAAGNVYVVDKYNHRVQKFDSSGGFLGVIGHAFQFPQGVAVDPWGDVYVSEIGYNHRVEKFDSSGSFLGQWGGYGHGDGQFDQPRDLAVGPSGSVYVTDSYNHRVQRFDTTGRFFGKWGSYGPGEGQFEYPSGVAVDSSGDVYVADRGGRVKKFDWIGVPRTVGGPWGGPGTGYFVAVDAFDNVYTTYEYDHSVKKLRSTGGMLGQWGSEGTGTGQFLTPAGVAVDASGSVYVADYGNHCVQKFSHAPTNLSILPVTSLAAYGGAITVAGNLTTAAGGTLQNRTDVSVRRSTDGGASWTEDGTAAFDSATQRYTKTVAGITQNTLVELRFPGDVDLFGSKARASVRARAWLSTPVAPRRVRAKTRFAVYGFLKPRHSGSTRLYFYRKVGRKYAYYRSFWAANANCSTYTKYMLRLRLPYKTSWYVRARHSDPGHASTWSGKRSFLVR